MRVSKKLVAVCLCGLCLSMAGCSKKATYENLNDEEKLAYSMVENVYDHQKDSRSMTIDKIIYYKSGKGDLHVSMKYNGKNGYGAYVKGYYTCDNEDLSCSGDELMYTLYEGLIDNTKKLKTESEGDIIDYKKIAKALKNDKGYEFTEINI